MSRGPRVRQTWIRGAERPCPHTDEDEIKSEGGGVLGWRCKGCLLLVSTYGPCNGCGAVKRLNQYVASRHRWWCTKDCHQQTLKRERDAKAGA